MLTEAAVSANIAEDGLIGSISGIAFWCTALAAVAALQFVLLIAAHASASWPRSASHTHSSAKDAFHMQPRRFY